MERKRENREEEKKSRAHQFLPLFSFSFASTALIFLGPNLLWCKSYLICRGKG